MEERRNSVRNRCLLGARVVFNNRDSTLNCVLRNYSEDGAMLKFGETPYLPDQIELLLDNRTTVMPAQIMWRRGDTVGIAFPRGRFMSELKEDAMRDMLGVATPMASGTFH